MEEATVRARTLRVISSLCCISLLTFSLAGQKAKKYKLDPYTGNDAKLMAKAGYVSFGPFKFGDRGSRTASTEEIEKELPGAPLIWVETQHFRIGSSLKAYSVPEDVKAKAKIRNELTRLHKIFPKVNIKTRRLDPWLRLHLTAMRMEDLYGEMQDWLGVTDKDFSSTAVLGKRYMGSGLYLGMPNKYLILVTQKEKSYLQYLKTFTGRQSKFGQRWNFLKQGALFYGIASELDEGAFKNDMALHSNLVFNMSITLIDGFRHYSYDLPVWIREGLGHYFQRKVSPKWNDFDQDEGGAQPTKTTWKWEPYTRRLIAGKKGSGFNKVMKLRRYSDIKFNDHVLIWSRVDFLLSQGKEKFAKFMFHIKGRVNPKTYLPDGKDLVGATREGLQLAYGLSPLTFDDKWKAWVKENYATR